MKALLASMVLPLCVCMLWACDGDSDHSATIPVTKVTFADKGAVVPEPVTTTTVFSPNFIEYTSMQNGVILEQWQKSMDPADFDDMASIINEYELYDSDDVVRASDDDEPWTGWSGMTITIETSNDLHTFEIMGDVDPEKWPDGVRELVNLMDALVEKCR